MADNRNWVERYGHFLIGAIGFFIVALPQGVLAWLTIREKAKDITVSSLNPGLIWTLLGTGAQVAGLVLLIWMFLVVRKRPTAEAYDSLRTQLEAKKATHEEAARLPEANPAEIPNSSNSISAEEREVLAIYRDMLNTDKNILQDIVHVYDFDAAFHIDYLGGFIDFKFHIFNGSMLKVRVGERIDGHLLAQGRELHDKPEPQTPRTIERGVKNNVIVRQRILPEIAAQIIDGATSAENGIDVPLDFENVMISLDSETPFRVAGPSYSLKVARYQKWRIKREFPREGVFLAWEKIRT